MKFIFEIHNVKLEVDKILILDRDGVVIKDGLFICPNFTLTNDMYPINKVNPFPFPTTLIKTGASVGAGLIILPGITIESNALIGAGSVVTRYVASGFIVRGNTAR